jgi:photosystem II stability/assembly factor-like uncharacterized protein
VVVPEPLVQRRRRPVALIALAAVVVVAAGAVYLRPAPATQPRTTPAATIDPLMVSNNPIDFAFVTPSMGWASMVFGGGSSGVVQFAVFRTTDGAKHWQQQLGGQSSHGLGYLPITVQLFGNAGGFLTVGQPVEQLYRTSDGGGHWTPLVLPLPRVEAITFSSPTVGWLVSYTGRGIPEQIAQLYRTSDAGQIWQQLPDPPADATDPVFRSPTEAWMGTLDPRLPHVYTSSDGGQSWRRRDLPPAVGSRANDSYSTRIELLPGAGAVVSVDAFRCAVALIPSGSPSPAFPPYGGFVPINGPIPVPTPFCANTMSETYVFASVDLGATWKQLPSPPGQVVYQDSVHWWAMSANIVFKTTDAGRSWRQLATIQPGQQFSVAGILDPTHAWASMFVMGGYGLALTHDGGLHWTLARVPAPT